MHGRMGERQDELNLVKSFAVDSFGIKWRPDASSNGNQIIVQFGKVCFTIIIIIVLEASSFCIIFLYTRYQFARLKGST